MKLIDRIISKENITKAINSVKGKSGSKTPGVDGITIGEILSNFEEIIIKIQTELRDTKYIPKPVKRIEIPKSNGETRPLGIPTLYDRIVQQCIKQILEPILDSKFHRNSFGFRPNRSAENALALNNHIINITKLYFVVDVDIKGFFDNVNHNKLIKQLFKLGIKDKKILSLIKTILEAEIQLPNGETMQSTKGTPQGGIISPLLANVVLNELDWWIDKQWLGIKLRHPYKQRHHKERAMRESTKLTEVRFVRYADDFKLYCRTREDAEKMFKLVKKFLKEKLKLEVSKTKSRVLNLKKSRSQFLGFEIKAVMKGKIKRVCRTWIGEKAKKNIKSKLKAEIILLKRNKKANQVMKFNSVVLGIQNYYRFATMVSLDLYEIGFVINKILMCRIGKYSKSKDFFYVRRYPNYNFQVWNVARLTLFTLQACKHKIPRMFPKQKENKQLIESNNNIIPLEVKQYNIDWERIRATVRHLSGSICYVTNEYINGNNTFDIHHIKPRSKGGSDAVENLVLLKPEVHKILHSKEANKFYIGNKKYEKLLESLSK
ncbi:MAG: group II intron reverse transcriptase/maturase [Fusobacteriaceae bacterium]